MKQVAIVTDSTACLPTDLIAAYDIQVVPISLIFEGRVFRDGVDISASEFYELLARSEKLPTTSPCPPGSYLEVFRNLGERFKSVLCITVARRLSGMFDSAIAAKETARDVGLDATLEVMDSGTAAMAQGFVVLAAARAAEAGKSLAEVVKSAQDISSKVNLVAVLDTLNYLAKGGRISKAAAWASSLLQIKPILQLSRGEVSLLTRARTKTRAVKRVLAIMKQRVTQGQKPHVAVFHANVPQEAQSLKEQLASQLDCAELYITQFTPVMGAHSGPGVLGVAFYSDDR
ncbi:MAG: DegV family protein [Chloroflexi bacterium]|nr:DegV family protein [Chloroflexota bacterium]